MGVHKGARCRRKREGRVTRWTRPVFLRVPRQLSGKVEPHPLLNGVRGAVERDDGYIGAVAVTGVPRGAIGQALVLLEDLVLHGLGENAARTPAPDFTVEGVEDDKIVCLPRREGQFDLSGLPVGEEEVEVDLFPHRDVERGGEGSGACTGLPGLRFTDRGTRSTGVGEGCRDQEERDNSGWDHDLGIGGSLFVLWPTYQQPNAESRVGVGVSSAMALGFVVSVHVES